MPKQIAPIPRPTVRQKWTLRKLAAELTITASPEIPMAERMQTAQVSRGQWKIKASYGDMLT